MSTPPDEPAGGQPESREDVLRRVDRETPGTEGSKAQDPSTRSGFTIRLLAALVAGAVVGYLLAFVVVGVLVGWGPAIVWGVAGALIVGVLTALLAATDEDGRIARQVGRREGPQPPPDETARDR